MWSDYSLDDSPELRASSESGETASIDSIPSSYLQKHQKVSLPPNSTKSEHAPPLTRSEHRDAHGPNPCPEHVNLLLTEVARVGEGEFREGDEDIGPLVRSVLGRRRREPKSVLEEVGADCGGAEEGQQEAEGLKHTSVSSPGPSVWMLTK